MRGTNAILSCLLLAANGFAGGEDVSLEDLKRRNEQLEQRVRRLEKTALDEDIDNYLERTFEGAEGPEGILPGGLAIRISGEIRIREEIKDRLYSPTDPEGNESFDFAHMRTRLRFDIDVLENVMVVIELQDVRILGEEGSTIADTEGVDLKRGMIVFKQIGGHPLDVEAGRFVMHYGEQRLVGHLEWFDQGRTYDGVRALYHTEGWWVDVFGVRVREAVTVNDDQWFVGAYGGWEWLEGYALVFGDDLEMMGETGMDDTLFVTLGFRIARKTGRWDYSTEVAFQTGDVRGDSLGAFAFAVVIGHTFEDVAWQPRVGIEVAYASGDESPTDGDNDQFQTLFPTNHLHYGYADLVGWGNILNLRLSVRAKPTGQITIKVDYHHFRRPEEQGAWINAGGAVVRSGLAGSSEHLGDEIDFVIVWKPDKPVTFEAGYALFAPGGFVEDTGKAPTSHFFYFQTRVKF